MREGYLFWRNWRVGVEWKPQDMWIGAFWKTTIDGYQWRHVDVWICLIPMLPLHVTHTAKISQ